jgi:hypothetical protein
MTPVLISPVSIGDHIPFELSMNLTHATLVLLIAAATHGTDSGVGPLPKRGQKANKMPSPFSHKHC